MINPDEILRRRDMRDVYTFTIDPPDAKDFDDALSFECMQSSDDSAKDPMVNGKPVYRIGVHIADVSFYVRPHTEVDEEAYKKGTSVYLVDKVIPMLPEELCNDLCSLRPGEDKLCMSVIFTMDADARVLKYKICRTVIRSDLRLDYDQVQEVLTDPQSAGSVLPTAKSTEEKENVTNILMILSRLASKLRAERIANGAMTIAQDEMHFRLDNNGRPVEIYFEQSNEAHHLIEEFMLLANRTVAKSVGSGRPFVYRVHDLPDAEKLEAVKAFEKRFSSHAGKNGISRDTIQRAVELLTIRAQAKAVYSTYNIGHYGLAFSHYTHFTSPIRRYPDLMVHRLVEKYILTGKKESMTRQEMELMCEHCSACEQDAVQAERESIKMFQAMYMSDRLGEIHAGHISGVTNFGLFVQLDENRCEGLIHITRIGQEGEYWQFDEKNYRLICENSKKSYTLGDAVRVKVVRADINHAQIDFEFA